MRITRVAITDPDARRLIEAVQQEYVVRYGGRDATPVDPAEFEPPRGSFFVGYVDGEPVASGAWRARSDVTALGGRVAAEIKRMYVTPTARRAGHASAMLRHLEDAAALAGADVMILETGTAQPEAMALYEVRGYVPIPSFGHYRDSPENRCYGRLLSHRDGASDASAGGG